MGTVVSVVVAGLSRDAADRAADAAFREMRRVESLMSTYLPDSDLSRLNAAAGRGWRAVHPEVAAVIREGLRVARLSGGAFDPSVYPVWALWRFEEGSRPPAPEALHRALAHVDYRNVEVDERGRVRLAEPGTALGLGGIAKGYAVDRALAVLRRSGASGAMVNAGGDLAVWGRPAPDRPWRVGVRDPRNPRGLLGTLSVETGAVATSGDYERFFVWKGVRYHHILDPRTGMPARGCRSVTVLHTSAMTADALATAVFVLGPRRGLELLGRIPEARGIIVTAGGEILSSPGVSMEAAP